MSIVFNTNNVGVFPGFPEQVYHQDEGLGSGSIKSLAESPQAYAASKFFPFEGNDGTDFGSAFHMRLLQPERYEKEVVEMSKELSFATKEGKEFKQSMYQERSAAPETLIFLKPEKVKTIKILLDGLERVKDTLGVDPFAEEGESETAHFWEEENLTRGKALVDRKLTKLKWLLDVKTTRISLDERSILRYAAEFGWATQAAWYQRGVRRLQPDFSESLFAFVVFQTTVPFSVRFLTVPEETLIHANKLVEKALQNYVLYRENEVNHRRQDDPNSGVLDLTFPQWFLDKKEIY